MRILVRHPNVCFGLGDLSRGGARTLGQARLAARCRDIERACVDGRSEDAGRSAGDLGEHIDEALAALKDHTANIGPEG